MKKIKNQLSCGDKDSNLKRFSIIGVLGTILLMSLALFHLWTSDMPRIEAITGSVFVVMIGIVCLLFFCWFCSKIATETSRN